jgi:diguanylate cyclase (GGDEF)-like protein
MKTKAHTTIKTATKTKLNQNNSNKPGPTSNNLLGQSVSSTAYKSMLKAMRQMMSDERIQLVLQKEGRNSIEEDWAIISQYTSFEEGVIEHAKITTLGEWGNSKLINIDYDTKTACFRVYNSTEALNQKEDNVCIGSYFLAGKLTSWCEKVFNVHCWPEQTKFLAKGDDYDEFIIAPTALSIESELARLVKSDKETCDNMAVVIKRLKNEITSRERAELAVAKLVYYDALTGVFNRRYFYEKLEEASSGVNPKQNICALLLIDLDYFKAINDSLGHNEGDKALIFVAEKLQSTIAQKEDAILARLGGDEFVILLPRLGSDKDEARQYATQIAEKILDQSKQACILGGVEHFLTYSVGICLMTDSDLQAEEHLKHADNALYQSKLDGRDQYSFFSRKMQLIVDQKHTLSSELKVAIQKEQFILHFQPIFNGDNQLVSCEALVRWNHPKKGLLAADNFIKQAEDSRLIIALGEIVLKAAFKTLKEWEDRKMLDGFERLSINISPLHFMHPTFVEFVRKTLMQEGVNGNMIMIEITEHNMISNFKLSSAIMNSLSKLGLRFSIDDYGSGYSSLSYLHRLPFSELKIDRTFITHVLDNEKDQKIVGSILSLAHSLDIDALVEGVENNQQLEYLKKQKCNLFQGYHLGKPVSKNDFEEKYLLNS